jgi:ribosome-associated protein
MPTARRRHGHGVSEAPDAPDALHAPDAPDGLATAAATDRGSRPSKTRLKQQAHDLQDLGEALTALPAERLDTLPLDESLRDALHDWHRTRSHEGRRRQMQYIGRLMRNAEVEPIREAVAAAQLGRAHDALALHRAERWRTDLLASDEAATRWLDAHPGADAQRLRTLVRNARKDAAQEPGVRSGRAYRELFQFIRAEEGSTP